MSQGKVTYVRDIADSNELSDVFITELEQEEGDELGTTVVMVADEGETRLMSRAIACSFCAVETLSHTARCPRTSGDRV